MVFGMNSTTPSETPPSSDASPAGPPRRRSWYVWLIAAFLLLAALPWVLAKTPLRDRMLNAIVNSDEVSVHSSNASFGYVAPLSLSGLQVRTRDQATQIEVERIQADHSWLGLLFSRPELGTFRFDHPRVDLTIDPRQLQSTDASKPNAKPPAAALQLPNLAAEINDAAVVVRTVANTKPPIDLDGIQLTVRIEREANRSMLRVEPSTVFDHQPITPELCGQGLQLVAPLLADEVEAQGEFSLRLDRFEVPLGPDPEANQKGISIQGALQLHQANVGLRNTIARRIGDMVFKLLGSSAPQTLTVAKDLVVQFEVIDGRVHHQGLALLLPHGQSSIEITSSGSVGLDESLDLQVAIQVPPEMLGGSSLVQRLTEKPIALAVTGSMKEPKLELLNQGGLLDSVRKVVDQDTDPTARQESVGELVDEAMNVVGGLLGGLRERPDRNGQAAEEEATTLEDAKDPSAEPQTESAPGLLESLRGRIRDRALRRRPDSPSPPNDAGDQPPPPQPDPPKPVEI